MATKSLTLFQSSIGKKLMMAVSGLFLCTFLVVHLIGNMQLFKDDQGLAFNHYAKFMTTNPLIKIVSYVNYFLILLHVLTSFRLTQQNKKARPVGYGVTNPSANSIWSSRNMGILGTIILVFIVVHMQDFWWKYHNGPVPMQTYWEYYTSDGDQVSVLNANEIPAESVATAHQVIYKDLYREVAEEFKAEILLVLLYIIAQIAIAFHLYHGFSSAFQTLGINHKRYTPVIKTIGYGFAIIIPFLFALMPIYFHFIK